MNENPPPRGSYRDELVISVIDYVVNSDGQRRTLARGTSRRPG
nr:MAG TPA: hypothetical protein [Caudoviricetes sp.]